MLGIVIKREDDDLSGPQVHTRPLIRREPGELEAPAQNTTNLSAATAADSECLLSLMEVCKSSEQMVDQ